MPLSNVMGGARLRILRSIKTSKFLNLQTYDSVVRISRLNFYNINQCLFTGKMSFRYLHKYVLLYVAWSLHQRLSTWSQGDCNMRISMQIQIMSSKLCILCNPSFLLTTKNITSGCLYSQYTSYGSSSHFLITKLWLFADSAKNGNSTNPASRRNFVSIKISRWNWQVPSSLLYFPIYYSLAK